MPQFAIWIAFGGLLFTLVSSLGAVAYKMGGLNQQVRANTARVKALEEGDTEGDGSLNKIREAFAEFRGEMSAELRNQAKHIDALQRTIEGQSRQLANIATGQLGRAVEIGRGSGHG